MKSKKISLTQTLLKQFEVLNVSYIGMLKLCSKGKNFENYLKIVLEHYPQADFKIADVADFDKYDAGAIFDLCSEAAYKDFIKNLRQMIISPRVTKEQIFLFMELVDSAFAFYHRMENVDDLAKVIEQFLLAKHKSFKKEQLLNVYDTLVHAVPEYDFTALETLPELACPDVDEIVSKAQKSLRAQSQAAAEEENFMFCQSLDSDGNMAEA